MASVYEQARAINAEKVGGLMYGNNPSATGSTATTGGPTEAEVTAKYADKGRRVDKEGLAYWMDPANNFSDSWDQTYNEQIGRVNQIEQDYRDTLGKEGDTEGIAYWNKADSGYGTGAFQKAAKEGSGGTAISDMSAEGTNYGTTWTGETDRDAADLYYDSDENKWMTPAEKDATVTPERTTFKGAYGDVGDQSRGINSGLDYVDQAKSTVAGQLQTLLSSDNPYITQARQGAIETAAGRGLLNSSIAAGKGQEAAIAAAMPIVQQDAGTYAASQAREQEGDITSTIQGEGYSAQGRLQEQGALQQMDQARLEGEIKMALQDAGFENDQQLQDAVIAGNQDAIRLEGDIQTARDTVKYNEARATADTLAANKTALTQLGLDADAANVYSQSLSTLTNTTLSTVNNLLNNIDIGDVPAAMESLKLFLGSTELGKNIYLPDLDLTGSITV